MPTASRTVLRYPSHPTTQPTTTAWRSPARSSVAVTALSSADRVDQPRRAGDATAVLFEESGQHRLGDLLGQAELVAVTARGEIQIQLGDDLAVGVKQRSARLDALADERLHDSERFEDLERPFVHDRRPVPPPGRVELVDQQARHVPPLELRRQQ